MPICPDCGLDHDEMAPEVRQAAETLSAAWVDFANKMIEADIMPEASFHFVCSMMGKVIRPMPQEKKPALLAYLVGALAEQAGAVVAIDQHLVRKENN